MSINVYKIPQKTGGDAVQEARNQEVGNLEVRLYVRRALSDNSLSNIWLINRLEERGIKTCGTELSSSLSGTRRGKKAEAIVTTSAEILHRYEKQMKGA